MRDLARPSRAPTPTTASRLDLTGQGTGGLTELYYTDQWQVIEERRFDINGTLTGVDQYVWSPEYVDELIRRQRGHETGM